LLSTVKRKKNICNKIVNVFKIIKSFKIIKTIKIIKYIKINKIYKIITIIKIVNIIKIVKPIQLITRIVKWWEIKKNQWVGGSQSPNKTKKILNCVKFYSTDT
jgi:hypothetical protein